MNPRAGGDPEVLGIEPRRPGRRSRLALIALALVVVGGLVLQHRSASEPVSVDAVRLRPGGTLAVTLRSTDPAVRVTAVSLRATGVSAAGAAALEDEVAAADARGTAPAHDPSRALAPGRHTFLLDVRAACPTAPVRGQVLLQVAGAGGQRSVAAALPDDVRRRLTCTPLSVRAAVSPAAATAGSVGLLLTAHAGEPQSGGTFQRLAWPGYRVSGVGGVVPLALGWAAADSNVVFNAVVTADCTTSPAGALTAVFSDRALPVPLTGGAAARVAALRAACP